MLWMRFSIISESQSLFKSFSSVQRGEQLRFPVAMLEDELSRSHGECRGWPP